MAPKPLINGGRWLEQMSSVIDFSKPVRVYRNLHRQCLSIKQGVVRCHTNYIFLTNVTYPVNTRVRDRVRKERKKEVHAYVMGYVSSPRLVDDVKLLGTVSYNPYVNDRFVLDNAHEMIYSSYAEIDHDGKHVHINAW